MTFTVKIWFRTTKHIRIMLQNYDDVAMYQFNGVLVAVDWDSNLNKQPTVSIRLQDAIFANLNLRIYILICGITVSVQTPFGFYICRFQTGFEH